MTKTTRIVAALMVVLVHVGLLWLYYHPDQKLLAGDERLYWRAARELAFKGATQMDPLWPPLHPHLLGWLRAVGGGLATVQMLQLALLLAAAFLARRCALGLGASAGVADGVFFVLLGYPTAVAFTHYLWPETLHLALFMAVAWILVEKREHARWLFVGGLCLGLAVLTKSLLGPFVPFLLLPVFVEGPRRAIRAGTLLLGLVVATSPVLLENRREHGRWMIADSTTFNIWIGLNDSQRRNFVDPIVKTEFVKWRRSSDDFGERNEILRGQVDGLVRQRGLWPTLRAQLGKQYFRLWDKDSFLTDQLPDGAISEALGRGYRGTSRLTAGVVRAAHYATYGLILVLAPIGAVRAVREFRGWPLLALGFVAYNLAIFLVLHVKTRYRQPMLPVLVLFAALGAEQILKRAELPALGTAGRVAAASAAALLLLFAFGGKVFG